ncbi:hypothetical protein D917_03318 [Trichinella nativa]|uniref:Uncharacterized protein n=1 Tax=Trichinella nativa TaxID=6335 RepID=A0A1Y3EEC4_9BILA|nr:hypothetical protein D917_03318 [Trichinella nativa]
MRKFRVLMRSTVLPGGNDGKFAILRTTQPQPANRQAMLVSNVILCQTSPGTLSFRFWSSPRVLLKICTRSPNAGTYFHKCFDFERREGGSLISVPVQYSYMRPFEKRFELSKGQPANREQFNQKNFSLEHHLIKNALNTLVSNCNVRLMKMNPDLSLARIICYAMSK